MEEPQVSPLRELTQRAQEKHFESPAEAAGMLAEALPLLPGAPGDPAFLARVMQHVLLGHLDDAAALAAAWQRLEPLQAEDEELGRQLVQGRLAAALVDGRDLLERPLPALDRLKACADAALALQSRADWPGVTRLLQEAERLSAQGGQAEIRAYAAMANNLATEIRDGLASSAGEAERVEAMLDAAARARSAWGAAGGWLQVERADYLLAVCHAEAGRSAEAALAAQECLRRCEANGADAFERFFAHEALALAKGCGDNPADAGPHLEEMRSLLEAVGDADSRRFAEDTLARLQARLGIAPG